MHGGNPESVELGDLLLDERDQRGDDHSEVGLNDGGELVTKLENTISLNIVLYEEAIAKLTDFPPPVGIRTKQS